MKALLVSYNVAEIAQKDLLALLDSRSEFRNWVAPFPGLVLVITSYGYTSSHIASLIRERFTNRGFVVGEIASHTSDGWMSAAFWELVNKPTPSPRHTASLAGLLALTAKPGSPGGKA